MQLLAKLAHRLQVIRKNLFLRQSAVGYLQAFGKVDGTIPHNAFGFVQNGPYLGRREPRMIQKRPERMNSSFEIDVIFPEGFRQHQ